MGYIIDISHHQNPAKIDYDKLCGQLDMAIIRVQYGSKLIDRYYKTHIAEMKKHNIPFGVYAWVRGVSEKDMQVEAQDFYNRAKACNPAFYALDVEEKSMANMRTGINAYIEKLRSLTDKKIGVYIAHHLYKQFNLDMSKFDAVWIPHYGRNNGQPNSEPVYPCDIHQYTSKGRLGGYNGNLDLNRLTGSKPLGFFTGVCTRAKTETKPTPKKIWEYYISGPAVKELQSELNKQFNAGLNVDGYFGDKTIAALVTVRMGAKGNLTKTVQKQLIANGYNCGRADGIFGQGTYNAVVKFQKANGLAADGIAGRQTWQALFKK